MSAAKAVEKTQAEIDSELKAMSERHIECRTFGHAWTPTRTIADDTGISIELACTRCTTKRSDRINRHDGSLDGRSYEYVDGYRGHGSVTRSTFRFEFISRNITAASRRKR